MRLNDFLRALIEASHAATNRIGELNPEVSFDDAGSFRSLRAVLSREGHVVIVLEPHAEPE